MKLGDFERIIKDAINEGLKEEMEKTLPVMGMSAREAIEKQVPLKAKPQSLNFACTKFKCGREFSVDHGDGYYSLPEKRKTNYCPDCGQRLL
ncbi:MAG: hypothetical protein [Bacteriophage sp.]|jgi:DNA-directed RNA polymerase subunit RPC12/RpoP|nr:MAG: hypothetical protein [Bacteriophage sp.]